MVSPWLWLSIARVKVKVQGFGRVRPRPRFVSSFVSSRDASPKRRPQDSVLGFSYARVSPFPHWRPLERPFAAAPVKQEELNEIIEEINSKFADAREEIELAAESKETVYFNEEAETAKKAVNEVLGLFNDLLSRVSEAERGALQRSMGLKMEQLKAEVAQLDE